MPMTRSTIVALAFACVALGAAGTYLLTGAGDTGRQATLEAAAEPTSVAPVDTTEAVVPAPEPAAQVQPLVEPRPAPARVARPVRRTPPPQPRDEDRVPEPAAVEPVPVAATPIVPSRAPEPVPPPAPTFEELVVSAESVIGLQVDGSISSEQAHIEDKVQARVTRDVMVGDRVAIPRGAMAHGEVTLVERGGKLKERARLGVRFTSIVLADGTRVPIETDVIVREGSSPTGESSAKIGGGAIGGAILGGILGGARGAILGGSAGAGAGTAVVLAGGRNPATLPSGTPITVRLMRPATVTVER